MSLASAFAAILVPSIQATSLFGRQHTLFIFPASVKDLLTSRFSTVRNKPYKKSQFVGFSSEHYGRKPSCSTKLKLVRASGSGGPLADEWILKLPDKKKPLYSHSLPCIEAWLRSLGFYQSREDRAVWLIEKPDWHAQLSMDITDLYIRNCSYTSKASDKPSGLTTQNGYLKSGPGNLERDVERKFSYALSREDIENAILGGP